MIDDGIFQSPQYGIGIWNIHKDVNQTGVFVVFQSPQYGIGIWNLVSIYKDQEVVIELSISSIWNWHLELYEGIKRKEQTEFTFQSPQYGIGIWNSNF